MSYISHTKEEIAEMLASIGVSSIEELFSIIPSELRSKPLNLPEAKPEFEVIEHCKRLAAKNSTTLINFIGAGFYDHYIPSAVDSLSGLPGFYTAYTPYQAEAAQGWLQAIYEYQSAICMLTGMEAANASLYDGGTALYEACMMAVRSTGKKRILMDAGVNLIYRTMLHTYTSNLSLEFVEIPIAHGRSSRDRVREELNNKTAAVIFQNPNFFGCIDDYSDLVEDVHAVGALAVMSVYPVSLGLLKTPGEMGVDIAVGEGQSLGLPLAFGGPYLGFMASQKSLIRKMPGRIIGRTIDRDGKEAYVMTLQAREQHIRRENATSNICSNEALCALRALIYLSLLNGEGLRDLAQINHDKAEFAKSVLNRIPGVEVQKKSPTFNEFTLRLPCNADAIIHKMIAKGFIPGFPLGRFYQGMDHYLLVAVTEKRTKEEIVKMAESLEAVLCD
ncbi:MAG: aminomethyl-transferring glycine dehydrogenase subunit GcvPA [Candidatus Ratteibacteria bacterium]|jgi:glycine dehydrogenase subunit 1